MRAPLLYSPGRRCYFGLLLYLCRVFILYTCDDPFYSFVVIQFRLASSLLDSTGSYGEAEVDLS